MKPTDVPLVAVCLMWALNFRHHSWTVTEGEVRHKATLVSPLTLMTPVMGVILGVILLNEPLTPNLVIGAMIAMAGVAIIGVGRNRRFPEAAVGDKIGQ